MSKKLIVVELVHMDTGKHYFEVTEDDNWKFPRHGLFKTHEEAEKFIAREQAETETGEV
jgi:hypothetical protein